MPLDSAAACARVLRRTRASFLYLEGAAVSAMRNPVRLVSTWPRTGRAVLAGASVLLLLAAGAPSAQTGDGPLRREDEISEQRPRGRRAQHRRFHELIRDNRRYDGQVRHQGHVLHQHRGGAAAPKSGSTTSCRCGCSGRGCRRPSITATRLVPMRSRTRAGGRRRIGLVKN